MLTHGALLHAGAIAEGMVVDAARMRRNLDLTGGLIVAEAVMMGLAPHLGRGEAHHVVKHACDVALAEGIRWPMRWRASRRCRPGSIAPRSSG